MNETKQGSKPVKELKYSWKRVQGKHKEILWFIDGNNSLRKNPSTTSVGSDHTGSEHTGYIHYNQLLGMCNIWFGISVNKQNVVLWFQRGFTIWLILWMSASGRLTEKSWLVDLCKMAVLWLELIVSGAAVASQGSMFNKLIGVRGNELFVVWPRVSFIAVCSLQT